MFGLFDIDLLAWRLCLLSFLHQSVRVLVLPASGWAFFGFGLVMVDCFLGFFFVMLYLSSFDAHFFWTLACSFTHKFSAVFLHFS